MPKTPPDPPAPPPKSPVATRIFEELGKIRKRLDTVEEHLAKRERTRTRQSSTRNIFGDEEE